MVGVLFRFAATLHRQLTTKGVDDDNMKNFNSNEKTGNVTLGGIMTFSKLENGTRTAQFDCCEDVQMEPFNTRCKVQAMRDGNVYITELPRRIRNKALYREPNSTLTLGNDGRYYFSFSIHQDLVEELPQKLVQQAGSIARKVMMDLIGNY